MSTLGTLRLSRRDFRIKEPITNQEWGHRSFRLVDPNGIEVYVFSKVE